MAVGLSATAITLIGALGTVATTKQKLSMIACIIHGSVTLTGDVEVNSVCGLLASQVSR